MDDSGSQLAHEWREWLRRQGVPLADGCRSLKERTGRPISPHRIYDFMRGHDASGQSRRVPPDLAGAMLADVLPSVLSEEVDAEIPEDTIKRIVHRLSP